jgi:hypothetical protein
MTTKYSFVEVPEVRAFHYQSRTSTLNMGRRPQHRPKRGLSRILEIAVLRRSRQNNTENVEGSTMRLILSLLALLLLLHAVSRAQTSSSPMEASSAAMASPAASPSEGIIGQPPIGAPRPCPPWFGFHPRPPRAVRIMAFVLRSLLALSAIFALTALGIFLIRRSRPSP